jgi:hypothetical protein
MTGDERDLADQLSKAERSCVCGPVGEIRSDEEGPQAAGVTRWRKKAVTVDAIQWTGTNTAEVETFCGLLEWGGVAFYATEGRTDGLGMVWNERQQGYLTVHPGYLIVRAHGDLIPEAADAYEPAFSAEDRAEGDSPQLAGTVMRVGHTPKPTLYRVTPGANRMADVRIGTVNTPELADLIVRAVNAEANALLWGTSCTSCARILDSANMERERAERADEKLIDVVALIGQFEREAEEMRAQAVQNGLHPALAGGHREANLLRQCAARLSAAAGQEHPSDDVFLDDEGRPTDA